ncbi:WXG100 family type VII secretion target [Amycolatopsis sp. cmx-4-68]|uniref:WXG100 family type VII secretion target n=1 Tax=Amycolatopsis sp. cmx-4-68 TaxID=2790938 RepID=UPI003978AD7A
MAPTAESVSDPSSPDYNPRSPFYDVTADPSSKYYIGPLKTDNVPSGDEIREMATKQIDDEIRRGWLGPVVDPVLRDKKIQELYQQHLDDAKHGLDEGLAMRETGGAPRTLWNNASHEQMNEAITQDANPATVAETSEEWVRVGNDLGTHQKTLGDAINASTSNWQGDAGDAVREHLAGVGKWLGATAQGATLAGRQQEIHSQALNETQRQMAANPPVQFDLQSTNQRLMSMTDPVQYASAAGEAMQTYRAQQAAREHAAQILTQYDETIGGAVATPRFPAPPKLPTATARAYSTSTRPSGGAGSGGDQPLLARTALDPALDPTAAGRTPAGLDAAALDGSGGAGGSGAYGSGAGGSGAGGSGAGIPGGGSGAGGSGFSGSGIPGDGSGGAGGNGIPGSGFSGSGIPGGGSGAGGSGGAGFTPPNFDMPDTPGGGSFSGAGIPGSSMPHFDDSTTSSGFTPSGIGGGGGGTGGSGFTPPNIPGIPDVSGGTGGPRVGGGSIPGFTPPGIDPITGLPTGTGIPGGGTGGIGGAKLPTIGRGGGINGESISSRLGGIGGIGGGGAGGGSLGGIGGGGSGAGGGGVGGSVRGTGAGSLSGGAASGAAAEAEAAAARNAGMAGKAGASGSPGMGGMGAGARGGKKEDDKEHKSADYLESDDPNFFAGEQVVAPPVIGDWKNQDWK